jgi:hypothetical protein
MFLIINPNELASGSFSPWIRIVSGFIYKRWIRIRVQNWRPRHPRFYVYPDPVLIVMVGKGFVFGPNCTVQSMDL